MLRQAGPSPVEVQDHARAEVQREVHEDPLGDVDQDSAVPLLHAGELPPLHVMGCGSGSGRTMGTRKHKKHTAGRSVQRQTNNFATSFVH